MTCHHTPRDEWSWCRVCSYCRDAICDLCYVPHTKTLHPERLACRDVAVESKTIDPDLVGGDRHRPGG